MPAASNSDGLDHLCCEVLVLAEGHNEAKSKEN